MSIIKLTISKANHLTASQAVISLADVVKELLDNSIDAKATNIKLTFHNYGEDLLEIEDNGIGMSKINLQKSVLFHHTNKHTTFGDISNTVSLGFRGQALSSIVELSEITVIQSTQHNTNKRNKITCTNGSTTYDVEEIEFEGRTEHGTCIQIYGIFRRSNDVRLSNFLQNLKKQFSQASKVINEYSLCYCKSLNVILVLNGKCILNTTGLNSYESLIKYLYNWSDAQYEDYIINIKHTTLDYCFTAYIPTAKLYLEQKSARSGYRANQKLSNNEYTAYENNAIYGGSGKRVFSEYCIIAINNRPIDIGSHLLNVLTTIHKRYTSKNTGFIFINITIDMKMYKVIDFNYAINKRNITIPFENQICAYLEEQINKIHQQNITNSLEYSNTQSSIDKFAIRSFSHINNFNASQSIDSSLNNIDDYMRLFGVQLYNSSDQQNIYSINDINCKERSLATKAVLRDMIKDNIELSSPQNFDSNNKSDTFDFINDNSDQEETSKINLQEVNKSDKGLDLNKNDHEEMFVAKSQNHTNMIESEYFDDIRQNIIANKLNNYNENLEIKSESNDIKNETNVNHDKSPNNYSLTLNINKIHNSNGNDAIKEKDSRMLFNRNTVTKSSSDILQTNFQAKECGIDSEIASNSTKSHQIKIPYNVNNEKKWIDKNKDSLNNDFNKIDIKKGISLDDTNNDNVDIKIEQLLSCFYTEKTEAIEIVQDCNISNKNSYNETRKNMIKVTSINNSSQEKREQTNSKNCNRAKRTYMDIEKKILNNSTSHNGSNLNKIPTIKSIKFPIEMIADEINRKLTTLSYCYDYIADEQSYNYDNSIITIDNISTTQSRYLINPDQEILQSFFLDMQVLGIYRNSFIICYYNNIIYIFDQHASDEKYRFEMLNINANIVVQPLAIPKQLSLTYDQKLRLSLAIESGILEKNGFHVEMSENNNFLLYTIPIFKNVPLNENDLLNLISMIDYENNSVQCSQNDLKQMWDFQTAGRIARPPRIWNILATKACRSAVKFNTNIALQEATKIIHNMSYLLHPWNCPHGRPTYKQLSMNCITLSNSNPADNKIN